MSFVSSGTEPSAAAMGFTQVAGTAPDSANVGFDEFINTSGGINHVVGSDFGDTFMGNAGASFEVFRGMGGNDFIDGVDGVDRVEYRNSTSGVVVNLRRHEKMSIRGVYWRNSVRY